MWVILGIITVTMCMTVMAEILKELLSKIGEAIAGIGKAIVDFLESALDKLN